MRAYLKNRYFAEVYYNSEVLDHPHLIDLNMVYEYWIHNEDLYAIAIESQDYTAFIKRKTWEKYLGDMH